MVFSILAIACFIVMTVLLVFSLIRFPSKVFKIDPNKNKKNKALDQYRENEFCKQILKLLLIPFVALVLIGIFVAFDNVPNDMEYIPTWVGGTFGFGLGLGWIPVAVLFAVVRVKTGIPVLGRWGRVYQHNFFKVVNGAQCGIAFMLSAIYFISFLLIGMTLTGLFA